MVTIPISSSTDVEILILGAGWTSTFLIPLLVKKKISYAATTTTGRDGTFKFRFEDHEDNIEQFEALPAAKTVLITFPLKGPNQSTHLVTSYTKTHGGDTKSFQYIQLGSTGIFSIPKQDLWITRHSRYDFSDVRAVAEDELLKLGGCVLDLSGLWGGERQVKHWIDRVAKTKEQLRDKTSLHMIHGQDVSRGILAVHQKFKPAAGQRYILTDPFSYDWWSLILGFAGDDDADNHSEKRLETQIKWVGELMEESKIRALPRSMEQLGRCLDSTDFWRTFDVMPSRARI